MQSRYDDNAQRHPPAPSPVDGQPAPMNDPLGHQSPYMNPDPAYAQNLYPPPRRRIHPVLLGCVIGLVALAGVTLCLVVVGGAVLWNSYSREIASRLQQEFDIQSGVTSTDTPNKTFQTSYIYDRNGNELHQLFDEGRRTRVNLSEISPFVVNGTIAVEDSTFYDNPGFDVTAVTRAGLNYFRAGGGGGASTITQQLVRNMVFDYEYRAERSARRKLEEVIMSFILTRERAKDEILELYLNTIYYGNLAYGIEAAAQTYFGKSAKELTLAESAMLIGLPQSPSIYDPLNPDPKIQETVLARRDVVLNLMVKNGTITAAQAKEARSQALNYANPNINLKSPHFTLYAEQELKNLLPAINLPPTYLNTAGLYVYTTLDQRFQDLAERVSRQQISQIKERNNANNAAVVIIKPGTGELLAMMGSVNYRDESIDGRVNIATSPRQPGSAMKPLTYAAAIERGLSPATILWDVPVRFNDGYTDYTPVNYDGSFHGPVRMRDALANSYNIPAVETLRRVGIDYFLNFAQRMGVQSLGTDPSQYGLSLTLGGGELTPLELTQAYTVFANDGNMVPTTSILCIVNNKNEVIYQYDNGCSGRRGQPTDQTINAGPTPRPTLDPRIAFVIRDILSDNAARTPAMGGNSPLRTDGIRTSVKTGTTNDFHDNWTVGFTSNVAVGVWVGNADYQAMQNTTGLTGAAPIWNQIITGIYNNPDLMQSLQVNGQLRPDEFSQPAGISQRQVCMLNSLREPAYDCQLGRSEWLFDSAPLGPDENGNLVPHNEVFAPTQAPANGPLLVSIDPDPSVVRALVFPLNQGFMGVPTGGLPSGQVAVPPLYCLVPNEVANQIAGANYQIFIKAPPFEDEAAYARNYAQSQGIAILPPNACTSEMIAAGPAVMGVDARILSPVMGDSVIGTVYVSGTASWAQGQAWYFKMEIQGPQFPDWTTFSGPTYTPVVNGQLGNFGATGLVPGQYQLRIVLVGVDGNYLMTSQPVVVNISGG